MKAFIYTKYGGPDVLNLKNIDDPIPKDNEILIEVYAISVNAGDLHLLRGYPLIMRIISGIFKPKNKILGSDVSGCVKKIGNNVKQFNIGDHVFGISPLLTKYGYGTFAEYVCIPEDLLVHKPTNISFEKAACLPTAGMTALQGIRNEVKIKSGQKILINGASGGVGTFAIQIAKLFGAEVTSVCSTKHIETINSIGSDYVIDYKKEDFTKIKKRYDLILAVNGYLGIFDYKKLLNDKGVYVMTGGSNLQMFQSILIGPLVSVFTNKKMGNLLMKPNKEDLLFIKKLVESNKIISIIDKTYNFEEIPEAIKYLEEGHANGKVVINIKKNNYI